MAAGNRLGIEEHGTEGRARDEDGDPNFETTGVSRACEAVRRYRVAEFLALFAVTTVVLLIQESSAQHELYVPPGSADGVNGYPVRLGSTWCTAEQLSACTDQNDTSACCRELEAGTWPSQTVSDFALGMIFTWVPVGFILARFFLVKWGVYAAYTSTCDALLALGFTHSVCLILTDEIKIMVGRPRPNYAALQAMAYYWGSADSFLKTESVKSFPSGHSSESMAGVAFVTLMCWQDLRRHHAVHQVALWKRTLLAYISALPILLSIWVGITRVRDYWHFQDDVLAGWTIGLTSAAVAIYWTSPALGWKTHGSDVTGDAPPFVEGRGAWTLMRGSAYESCAEGDGAYSLETRGAASSPV